MKEGKLIIFAAPSGTGKSTIVKWLMREHPELGLRFSVSTTTRSKRVGERDGVDYFFISPDEFRDHIGAGDFVEYEEVYAGTFYGTLKSQVERQLKEGVNVVFDVDVNGALRIKECYGDRALALFIMPPGIDALRCRLMGRGTDSVEVIEKRLARAEYELAQAERFDVRVVNDVLEVALEEVLEKVRGFVS